MTNKKKSIGNEQPIPIDIMIDAIIEYLETKDIDKEGLLLKVKEQSTSSGDNRAKKAVNAIYSVITKPSALNKAIIRNFTPESFYKLSEADKNIIIISLVCLRFPFTYDLLFSFSKLLNIQDLVNKQYINEKMASMYGSNLSLEHGIEAAMKTSIDCKFITRDKPGLFSKGTNIVTTNFAKEAWISTYFELNGKKILPINELKYEPIMSYLSDFDIDWNNTKILETMEDSSNQLIIHKLK